MKLKLHRKQGAAFTSTATEILYGGAAGGGKSHLKRAAGISWCYDIPGLQVYLFRRTSTDLWKNHMFGPGGLPAMLAEWVNDGLVKINDSRGIIKFWNGSQINLCHCQHEKDVFSFQGAEIHVLMIDELTQWPWSMYTYLRGRVRIGGLKVPERYKGLFPRILCGANPGGIGHNSVKFAFIDQAKPLAITQMPKADGGMKRQYIPAVLEDNPTLTENDPDYESRLEGLGSKELVKAMRWGLWDIVAGGAIDDVWEPATHIIEPFEIPRSWKLDRGFDWGSSKPYSVCWFAESDGSEVEIAPEKKRTFPKGTLFLVAEDYGWNGTPDTGVRKSAGVIASEIKETEKRSSILNQHRVAPGPADTSIWDADDEGKSIASKMQIQGIRWTKADKRPGSRKAGLEEVRDRFRAGLKLPMEEPGFFIFSTCEQFIRTVPTLPRDPRDMDDVDTKAEDHIYDVVRYKFGIRKKTTTTQTVRL